MRDVNDYNEYYSNLFFVYGPRLKYGILRVGAQWERYSFGFPEWRPAIAQHPPGG